jgi:spore germination protein
LQKYKFLKDSFKSWNPVLTIAILLLCLLTTACGGNQNIPPILISSQTPSIDTTPNLPLPLEAAIMKNIRLGYYTNDQTSWEALQAYAEYINIVSLDIYSVNPDGSISGSDDFGAASFAQSKGMLTYACVNNWNSDPAVNEFDPDLARVAILTQREKTIAALIRLAQDGGYDGINIDLESLAYTDDIKAVRSTFSSFIHELATQLHNNGFKLIISVPGQTESNPDNTWSYPFDMSVLGQDADYLQLMTYDQHGPWNEPGAVAGWDWVEDCLVYSTSVVDPAKLLIGLPAYGYDWDITSTKTNPDQPATTSFYWKSSEMLLSKTNAQVNWDDTVKSPYITYQEDGHEHVAWYENEKSIQAKTDLLIKYHLAGFSMWSIGQEDEQFWQAATSQWN